MIGFFKKFSVYCSSDGFWNAVRYAFKTLLNLVYVNSTTVFLRCVEPLSAVSDSVAFKILNDKDEVERLDFPRLKMLDCDGKLRDGHRLYVGFVNGKPVSYSWTAMGSYHILYVGSFELGDKEYWIGPTFVLNAFRGRGLNKAGINRQIHDVDGVCYTSVNSGNKPSLHSFLSLGFEEIGRVKYKKFLCFSSVDIKGSELKSKMLIQ